MGDWQSIETVPMDGSRIWLALKNGSVALGFWKLNSPQAYLPGHWSSDLGICSDQADLGDPVAWLYAEIPEGPPISDSAHLEEPPK